VDVVAVDDEVVACLLDFYARTHQREALILSRRIANSSYKNKH
jgi:hypothetical protein